MRLTIPLLATLVVRPEGGGCHPSSAAPSNDPRALVSEGRIGVAGHADGEGVRVDAVGVGSPADGRIEPGEVIVAIEGIVLSGQHSFVDLQMFARGAPGTEVHLSVANASGERDVTLTRAALAEDIPRRAVPLPAEALVDRAIRDAGAMDCLPAFTGEVTVRGELGASLEVQSMSGPRDGAAVTCLSRCLRAHPVPVAGGRRGTFEWSARRFDAGEADSETDLAPEPAPIVYAPEWVRLGGAVQSQHPLHGK